MISEPDGRTVRSVLNLFVLVFCAVYFIIDIIVDFRQGETLPHMVIEALVFSLIVIFFMLEILARKRIRANLVQAESRLEEITSGLAAQVRGQFDQWGLSPSEKEVAWLIIKGFSFQEIAALRDVKEKTVRHQATSVYAKAKVGNRSEFTASFLEDLLAVPVVPEAQNRKSALPGLSGD